MIGKILRPWSKVKYLWVTDTIEKIFLDSIKQFTIFAPHLMSKNKWETKTHKISLIFLDKTHIHDKKHTCIYNATSWDYDDPLFIILPHPHS